MSKTFNVPNKLIGKTDKCSTVVLRCTDFRFRRSDQKFVEQFLMSLGESMEFDSYVWPGGHKDILTNEAFRSLFFARLQRVSIDHHGVTRIIVLMHWDCFGFNGLKDEAIFRKELATCRAYLLDYLPAGMKIVLCYSKAIFGMSGMLQYVVLD